MKSNAYAIYDTASGVYDKLIFAGSDGIVTREFSDLVQNAEHIYGQHPEDFSLFRLGMFDNITGRLTDEKNECLATGLELIALARNVRKDNVEKLEPLVKEANAGRYNK